jgi:lipoprotein NlpD
MRNSVPWTGCLLASLLLLSACAGSSRAPSSQRTKIQSSPEHPVAPAESKPASGAKVYTVVRGDTLYSIAWKHGTNYHDVARWNGIESPYLIYPDQKLKLYPPQQAKPKSSPKAAEKAASVPANQQKITAAGKQPSASGLAKRQIPSSDIKWRWPTSGKVQKSSTRTGKKGVEIVGVMGQPVIAAAPGEVVYSGGGLIGYGKLIILKHNDEYLSAYAHNSKLLVAEGINVGAGQRIAEMGSNGSNKAMLHFEIRRNGEPVPPLEYLPRR